MHNETKRTGLNKVSNNITNCSGTPPLAVCCYRVRARSTSLAAYRFLKERYVIAQRNVN